MRRPLAVLALLVQGFAVGCVSMAHDPRWVVVKSPRFEIYSTFAAEDSKTLAEELERFHALIYAMTNAPHGESVVPTRIFAFAQRTRYLELAPADSAGVFMPSASCGRCSLYSWRTSWAQASHSLIVAGSPRCFVRSFKVR